jgi:hypothetical protein
MNANAVPTNEELEKMTKTERMTAAKKCFDNVEEYSYWPAVHSLMFDFAISCDDAEKIVRGDYK